MKSLKKLNLSHYINYAVVGIFTLVFSIIAFSGSRLDSSVLFLFEKVAISIILAVSLSVVVGFLGELSLGHAGFMCVGAYIGGKVSVVVQEFLNSNVENHVLAEFKNGARVVAQLNSNDLLNLLISLVVGGLVAALCGVIIGIPALRLRGDYLAIVTLAFGEIVRSLFLNLPEDLFGKDKFGEDSGFGGTIGLETPRFDKRYLFVFAFIIVLITLIIVQNFIRSKHGRAVTSIRDNEIAARACGINVTKYKLLAFIVSAFFAGIAGVLYSFSNSRVQSTNFDYNYSIEILVMVVLGGMGNINGAIISATLITYLNSKLPTILTGDLAVLQNLIYALVLILIVIYNNAPSLKGFRNKYNLSVLIKKVFRSKSNEASIRDDANKWDVVPTKIEMNEILSVDMKAQNLSSDKRQKGGDK